MDELRRKKRVLIIKLSSLGDLFHALPAVHNLKMGLNADIDWVTHRQYADLLNNFTDVSRVISFPRRDFFRGLTHFVKELRTRKYDYVVDLQGLLKSAFCTALARGENKIGPSFHREGSALFYSAVAGPRNKNRHAVEENLDIVRHLGLPVLKPEFPVRFPQKKLEGHSPRIGILPASRWMTKNWPAACFADTLRILRQIREVEAFLLGGAEDAPICDAIAQQAGGNVVNLAGKMSLTETGSLLQELDLLVANDSGPVHMAAAVGTPVLVIFGPTDPDRTGPYGEGHRVARVKIDCQPCFSRTCRRNGIPCLSGVTPEHVADLVLDMLSVHPSLPPASVPT